MNDDEQEALVSLKRWRDRHWGAQNPSPLFMLPDLVKTLHVEVPPDVAEGYAAFIKETLAQYQLVKKRLKIELVKPGLPNPYPNGEADYFNDVRKNNHYWFFPTVSGLGNPAISRGHPLHLPTNEYVDGHRLLGNDVFRIVHDQFGHNMEGLGFGPNGEHNAWRVHVLMFSPMAARAMTTETEMRNSWTYFGPVGEVNRTHPTKTTYAIQKAGLAPQWIIDEAFPPAKPGSDGQ